MAVVEFWEKPGCAGNARQRASLEASGHTVIAHNLLAEPWTASSLQPFFGARPVAEWFNRNATRVKSGEVRPESLNASVAWALLLTDPLLIRRPLMRVGAACRCGFDADDVAAWIGLGETSADETCQRRAACGCGGADP